MKDEVFLGAGWYDLYSGLQKDYKWLLLCDVMCLMCLECYDMSVLSVKNLRSDMNFDALHCGVSGTFITIFVY